MLLVDIGNSMIEWSVLDTSGREHVGRAPRPVTRFEEFFERHWRVWAGGARVYVSNVADSQIVTALEKWMGRHGEGQVELIRAQPEAFGLVNGYENPSQLGSDRWLAMIAASRLTEAPFGVIDCGTAITADIVDEQRRHLGGLIAPGLAMLGQSLEARTADTNISIPGARVAVPSWSFRGRTTEQAVCFGVLTMVLAFVERVQEVLQQQFGTAARCFVTGGDAAVLRPHLRAGVEFVPSLVLQGLKRVAVERERCRGESGPDERG